MIGHVYWRLRRSRNTEPRPCQHLRTSFQWKPSCEGSARTRSRGRFGKGDPNPFANYFGQFVLGRIPTAKFFEDFLNG